ncbi:MAG TPA: hypothetical protein ENK05_05685 [Gammaproteobacteria bacterium]|nr:hypothetical protein [Gammaproteobacteria bacterium]
MAPVTSNILIIAGDADGNLGDRAILHSMVEQLRSLAPDIHISCLSSTPETLTTGLRVTAIRRGMGGMLQLIGAALRADLVLCGGGGLFQDDDSLIKMPYWAARVLLVRACCRRIIGYSLGVGPLSAMTSRLCARIAFRCMERVSTRDPIARNTATALTPRNVELLPDPALALAAAPRDEAMRLLEHHAIPLDGRPLVGVAVRRWFPPAPRLIPHSLASRIRPGSSSPLDSSERMCALLARTLDRLVQQHEAHIVFLPTYNVAHEGDDQLCGMIQNRMERHSSSLLRIHDPRLYKAVSGELAVLLGGRMHPTILAAGAGTPIVGLAYNPKFSGFFTLLGLDDHVMDVVDFVESERHAELADMVTDMMRKKPDFTPYMAAARRSMDSFNREILEAG